MDVLKLVLDAKTDLNNEGGLVEHKNLVALGAWIGANRNKTTLQMEALRIALVASNESLKDEQEDPEKIAGEVERMVQTLSSFSHRLSLARKDEKWLNEVLGDFSALLAQCVMPAI
jgi:hypothetical protein